METEGSVVRRVEVWRRRRLLALGLAFVVGLAPACSDQSLTDLGGRSSGWINEPVPSAVTTTAPPPAAPVVRPITDVTWFSDDLGIPPEPEPASVLQTVIGRSSPGDRFLHASRFEIAIVLPQLEFFDRVPVRVTDVTSQLVSPGLGGFAPGQVAAFGLWAGEPYQSSRSVGQLGVLEVDLLGEETDSITCGSVSGDCAERDVSGRLVLEVQDNSGVTWIWDEEELRYRLFLRDTAPEVAEAMIAGVRPLSRSGTPPTTVSG